MATVTPTPRIANILWAEDTEGDRRLIELALQEAPVKPNIQFLPDGPKLLEAARVNAPDLVVLDLNMPGMHGIEVLQRLRADEGTKGIPVIVFSSSSNLEELSACGRLGATAVVHKPNNLEAFTRAVARIARSPPVAKAQ